MGLLGQRFQALQRTVGLMARGIERGLLQLDMLRQVRMKLGGGRGVLAVVGLPRRASQASARSVRPWASHNSHLIRVIIAR